MGVLTTYTYSKSMLATWTRERGQRLTRYSMFAVGRARSVRTNMMDPSGNYEFPGVAACGSIASGPVMAATTCLFQTESRFLKWRTNRRAIRGISAPHTYDIYLDMNDLTAQLHKLGSDAASTGSRDAQAALTGATEALAYLVTRAFEPTPDR